MDIELLHKYFRGETSEAEEKRLLDWVNESEENRHRLLKERELFDMLLFADLPQVKERPAGNGRQRGLRILRWSARVAATVLIAISCGILWNNYQDKTHGTLQSVVVPTGQRVQLILADGSHVWLNSKSTLTYATNFGRDNRDVRLDGEGYFEVAKNKALPFRVNTEAIQVKVVGTRFNVCAYKEGSFETKLIEGIVDLYNNKDSGKNKDAYTRPLARLTPGEYFEADHQGYKKGKFASQDFLLWREGLYCFDDAPFHTVLSSLERYYDVQIKVENRQVLNYHCTGKFKETDGIDHILKVIQLDHPFRYDFSADSLTVRIY
jgi:ferric-dicitrate binding protein FerR (iron transport regulator)